MVDSLADDGLQLADVHEGPGAALATEVVVLADPAAAAVAIDAVLGDGDEQDLAQRWTARMTHVLATAGSTGAACRPRFGCTFAGGVVKSCVLSQWRLVGGQVTPSLLRQRCVAPRH